jgi:hypothetical protein
VTNTLAYCSTEVNKIVHVLGLEHTYSVYLNCFAQKYRRQTLLVTSDKHASLPQRRRIKIVHVRFGTYIKRVASIFLLKRKRETHYWSQVTNTVAYYSTEVNNILHVRFGTYI